MYTVLCAYQNIYTLLFFILIGVTLHLTGYNSIPNDGSGRIVITDINPDGDNDGDTLICQSHLPLVSSAGNYAGIMRKIAGILESAPRGEGSAIIALRAHASLCTLSRVATPSPRQHEGVATRD